MTKVQFFILPLLAATLSLFVSSTNLVYASDNIVAHSNELIDSLNKLSYNSRRNNPKLSLEYAIKAHDICKNLDYKKGLAFAIHNMGTAKAVLGRYDVGLLDLIEASGIREEIEDYEGLVSTYNNIGFVFSEMGNDRKALEFYEKAIAFQQITKIKRDFGIVLNNIGYIYFRNGELDKALEYFYRALKVNEEVSDERGASASKSNIGTVYRSMGEYKKGLEYHYQAYEIGRKFNDNYGVISTLRSISEDYKALEQLDKATNYALRSLIQAQEIGATGEEKTTAALLAGIYESRGRFKESARYFKLESRLKDSLFNVEKAEVLGRMQAAYELESKAKENEFLKKEQFIHSQRIRLQQLLLYISVAFLIIASLSIGFIIRTNKKVKIANNELLTKNDEILVQKETIQEKVKALDSKNAELLNINQIKDKLISVIAHDLKNPFNGISGYSEIIISQYNTYSESEILSFLRIIHDNAIKGNMLLDNLLNWSRLQTRSLQFIPVEQNLYKLIFDELFFVQHIANEKKINLATNINKELMVFADSNMLKTVIRNLVSNALKFTRSEGSVSISAENVNNSVQIIVSDTGQGIDPSVKQKLFTGEAGVTTANQSGEKGTGLGLMLCKDFVDKHNGKIWVESESGKGSSFYIVLPNKPINNQS